MEDIPFKHLPISAWRDLEIKLEPPHNNNWSKLAEKIANFTTEEVLFLESKKGDKTCTRMLFEEYVKRENASVNKVKAALEEMERKDALDVLNKYLPEIQRNHQEEITHNAQCFRSPTEHSIDWSHYSSPHSSLFSGCCSPGSHMNQLSAHHTTGCHVNPCHSLHSPPVSHHGGHSSSHPLHISGMFMNQNGHHLNGLYNPAAQAYYAPPYRPNIQGPPSDSMLVHSEPVDMSMDDVVMADGHRTDRHRSDEPAPLPQGIMRGSGQLPSFSLHPHTMGRLGGIDVAREEVVENSPREEMEYITMGPTRGKVGRPGYFQQHSEEMNSKQPFTEKCMLIKKKILNNPDQGHLLNSRPVASPPISKLQRLANLPPEYQPDQEYKNFVADQKVEEAAGGNLRHVKQERVEHPAYDTNTFMDISRVMTNKKNMMRDIPKTFPRVKPHNTTGPVLSDLRANLPNGLTKSTSMPVDMKPAEFRKAFRHIKVFVTYSNDNKKHLQRVLSLCNCLVKNGFSCCVDINNRYIATLPNQHDKVNWYRQKFEESDFILVCPSPKYKTEITAQDSSSLNSPVPENQLHTRFIYKLMHQEYETQSRNLRFVPVLFDGIPETLLPNWLQASLIYRWPSQFKDLLWMLTRPEERIKPKPRPFTESNSQSNSPHHHGAY